MRSRFLSSNGLATLVILAVATTCGWEFAHAAGGPHGEKIEFSEPISDSPVVVSNLNKLSSSQSTFKQVKEDLLRPFGSMDPRNSLQNFMTEPLPPPRRPVQVAPSKHTQELMDKRKNWAFTSYEDLLAPPTPEQAFGLKDNNSLERKSTSVVDKYYEALDQKHSSGAKRDSDSAENARAEFINRNGFDPLGKSFDGSDPFMKRMFTSDPSESVAEKETAQFQSISGSTSPTLGTVGRVRNEHTALDDIRRSILGPAAVPFPKSGETGATLSGSDDYFSKGNKTSAENLLNQQLSQAAEARKNSANPFIMVDPAANALHSHINDDLTARALGLPNPVKSAEAAKPLPSAQSVETQLDPFAGNRMKRKF
jgi:hypothetical protein